MDKKVICVTGSLGFIGSNFVRQVVHKYPEYRFFGIDNASKEYSLTNNYECSNYKFYLGDIADQHFMNRVFYIEKPNIIINFAAHSFVDWAENSFNEFIHSNVYGMQTIITSMLKYDVEKIIHISTDECLGEKHSISDKPWTEESPIAPRNLYASSKGCSELILMANHYTHKFKYNITRSVNVFSGRQKQENLIPKIITSLIQDVPITIQGTGENFRQYIYVDDKINAIMKILKEGKDNEIYNISDDNYLTNLEMVNFISKLMNKEPKIKFVEDRKAHDWGYSLSSDKLRALGWKPTDTFENNMKKTIDWYVKNKHFYGIS